MTMPCIAESVENAVSTDTSKVTLRVLSYNIQALPSPLKENTEPLFIRIAEMFQELRAQGTQPHVVLIQEAFDGKSDVILANSGYKYILKGPNNKTQDKRGNVHWAQKTRKAYVSFTNPQKFMGSGLAIMSDYPIIKAHHNTFKSDECAGLDCLANKSIQMARIQVPGISQPVDIFNNHFNSFGSDNAPEKTSHEIFFKQTDKLKWFLGKVNAGNPLIVAGDFNTKKLVRYDYFVETIGMADAGEVCVSDKSACRIADGTSIEAVLVKTNDKHFYSGSSEVSMQPYYVARNFDEKLDGRELSDHLGYEVHYYFVSRDTVTTN